MIKIFDSRWQITKTMKATKVAKVLDNNSVPRMVVKMEIQTQLDKVAREDLRMIMQGETSSASTAKRPICLIPLFIHIWSKSTRRVPTVRKETRQPAVEEEADPEKILTRDLTQGLKTSSRLQREKEAQLMYSAASKRSTISSFLKINRIKINKDQAVIYLTMKATSLVCMSIQFSNTWSSSQI